MKTISIDIETYCEADLSKCGVYRYAEDPSFEILLFGVSIDEKPVITYDLASGQSIPDDILKALVSKDVLKYAFNASFERVCLSVYLRKHYPELMPADDDYLDPVSWRCDMVLAAYNGLPLSLAQVGTVLGFEKNKLTEGKRLVSYFCTPCKPTKVNGGRTRNRPSDASDHWARFKQYNIRDVEVQLQIHQRLEKYPVPDHVWQEYFMDQRINDRGIRIDQKLVDETIRINELMFDQLMGEMKKRTGLENPNSAAQLKKWLSENGIQVDSIGKDDVKALLPAVPDHVRKVLELRLQLAKSSIKKYQAMRSSMCHDGRCHGLFQFYGANRTGRFAGRLIQLQNLPQNHMSDLDEARSLVKDGDFDTLQLLYDSVPQVLSELIRTAFIPKDGYKFIVADFSSIEARVIAYLSKETWKSEAFARGEDIYCSTASKMFGKPVIKHGLNGDLRPKGKVAELACGYGGSVGALKRMGALNMGLLENELQSIVDRWREANPHIVGYWYKIDNAAKNAILYHRHETVDDLEFYWRSGVLFIRLPSDRTLSYLRPQIGTNRFGGESITYMGLDDHKHWSRIESYGAKLVENIVQGVARDILCFAMKNLTDTGIQIVAHVHDECICEVPMDTNLQQVCDLMGQTPPWAPGLLLRADGYECSYYQKD